MSILCATVPALPTAPLSTVLNGNVVFSWAEPSSNGTPITGYTLLIKQSDGSFSEQLTDCDGNTDTSIV